MLFTADHDEPRRIRNEARGPGYHLTLHGGGGSHALGDAQHRPVRAGWGNSLSTCAPFEGRDCHPTPPLISFASTLPIQGRVRKIVTVQIAATSAP
jgi:hypothetical protein